MIVAPPVELEQVPVQGAHRRLRGGPLHMGGARQERRVVGMASLAGCDLEVPDARLARTPEPSAGRVNDGVFINPVRERPRSAAERDGGRCAARGIYRARRRVSGPGRRTRLVLLGDPPSFDEDDADPHCCVVPLDAVALPSRAATAACRARHGPAASCSAPMASRLRYLVTVYGPGCLPGHRDYLKRHDSLSFDAGLLPASRRAPRTFRRSREAADCRI